MQKGSYKAYNLQLRKEIEQALKQLQIQGQVRSNSKQETKKQSIHGHEAPSFLPPSNFPATFSQAYVDMKRSKQENKKEIVCQKIAEIISLCSDNEKYREIKEAEEQVLNILQSSENQRKERKRRAKDKIKREGRGNGKQCWQVEEKNKIEILSTQQAVHKQINTLRYDNINLMKSLNKQIKQHNEEKVKSRQARRKIQKIKSTPHLIPNFQQRTYPVKTTLKNQLTVPPHLQRSLSNFSHSRKSSKPKIQNRYEEPQKKPNQNFKTINGHTLGRLAQSFQYYYQIPYRSRIAEGENNIQLHDQGCQNSPEGSNKFAYPQTYKAIQRNQVQQLKKRTGHHRNMVKQVRGQAQQPPSLAQIQELLVQGADLCAKGEKLIKVRSNPHFYRTNIDEKMGRYDRKEQNKLIKNKDKKIQGYERL